MAARPASSRWSWVWLGLLVLGAGCSRGESRSEGPLPSASASAGGARSAAASASPERKHRPVAQARPAVTPKLPPQLVACVGGRDFYRITDRALEVFEVSKTIPPPNLRGSAAAVQVASVGMERPLNVVPVATKGVLVIGKQNVFRYEPGAKNVRTSAPIPTPGPLFAWPDSARAGSFWVRVSGEKSLHSYAPGATPNAAPVDREHALPDFDARLFTLLADGAPFYSTPLGLRSNGVRRGDVRPALALPKPAEAAALLFPDVSPERYWAADAQGNLTLWQRKPSETPLFSARVPGAVIDASVEGGRVAVLSIEAAGPSYRPFVTIFADGQQIGQLRPAWTPASGGQPKLDLCLIPGRPWVVVGGTKWMQLHDWQTPRLLSEW